MDEHNILAIMAPSPSPEKSREAEAVAAAVEAEAEAEAEGVDLLVTLPPQMVDEVLSRLPVADTVRTSALSRSWRHRWEAVPSLDLLWPARRVVSAEAVDAVLRRYAGRVRRFSALVSERSARRLGVWLRKLSRRGGLESLSLDGTFIFPLHASVFTLPSLTSLDLSSCRVPALPAGFAGFPGLTELKFSLVELPVDGEYHLQDIIAKSPLLQTLYLVEARTLGDTVKLWVIEAPNLRHLTLSSFYDCGCIFGDFPLLDSALIELCKYVSDRDFGELVGKLRQARMLNLNISYKQSPHSDAILETLPCSFDNLKILKLKTHFLDMPNIISSFCMLRNSPNLEVLKMKVGSPSAESQLVEANGDFQNAQWTESMFANLQEAQIKDISCFSNEMSFIELVLSKAKLLRKLSIRLEVDCFMSKDEALGEFLKYKRASPNAEVSVEDFDESLEI